MEIEEGRKREKRAQGIESQPKKEEAQKRQGQQTGDLGSASHVTVLSMGGLQDGNGVGIQRFHGFCQVGVNCKIYEVGNCELGMLLYIPGTKPGGLPTMLFATILAHVL